MTLDEFQCKYYDYMTQDESAAKAEAERVNAVGVDGDTIVAVQFGSMWCLMLRQAFEFTREIGIESQT